MYAGLDPEGSFTGGGTSSRRLEMSGGRKPSFIGGGSGGVPPGIFFKIYVSENAFQPFFPYFITSILCKIRHSNPRGVLRYFTHTLRRRKLFFGVQNFEF